MAEVNVNMTGKVNNAVQVRTGPSTGYMKIGSINAGETIKITKKNGQWVYSEDTQGWSYIGNGNITLSDDDASRVVNQDADDMNESTSNAQQEIDAAAQEEDEEAKAVELNRQLGEIESYLSESNVSNDQIADALLVRNLNGIYGIPYQFMENVDPRITPGSQIGRKYADKIISKMPLLCITPGKVSFMSNFSKREKKGILAKLISGDIDTDISDIINNNGRYYTFEFDYPSYFDYVNGLCRAGARFLDIQNVILNIGDERKAASDFDWSLALNKNLKATFTSQEFIGFYMDSTDSVSENFSSDTTQSQLSSTLNGLSDTARELKFLLGMGTGEQLDIMNEEKLGESMSSIEDITNKYLNGNQLIKNITNNFATIATGGKLLFPEIWSDTTFSRSFDITIKLRTPDADVMSWYLNIYVPLCHLVAFAAARQLDNPNGYYSPFLVRAFYKGLFNVDMGIVTDMSITKGKEAAWNVDGLPTEIDVNLTIKDLYNMMHIVPGIEPKAFVTNNIMMDYVANLCGININQMDIERSFEIYYILAKNKITDIPNKTIRRLQNMIDNYAMKLYTSTLDRFLL